MPKQIVVTVSEFEADTPEQAEEETRSILGRYEGKQFVYARHAPSPSAGE
jgi:predicted Zn-dependent protease with MMP-like domain